ncbi:2866_t:CDS:1, partial [Gigaspora rosea]
YIALFAFIFIYLHATLLCRADVGDKAAATFKKLNSTAALEQIDEYTFSVYRVLNKGIDENATDIYYIDLNGVRFSFAEFNISINPPKAGPWNATTNGDMDNFIGAYVAILYDNNTIDDAFIIKE